MPCELCIQHAHYPSWTGTPVSLPAQQLPWPVTRHMTEFLRMAKLCV